LAPRSILIVEDDDDIREDLAALLRLRGYEVSTSANGREALERLQRGPLPSVILLDLMMPVMNGWELRAHQLADPSLAPVPVAILSGHGKPDDFRELRPAACLSKPFDVEAVFEIVERLCAQG
jgi:CheY-like chemotaxis protein